MTATDVRYVLPEDADLVPLPEAEEVLLSRRGSRTTPQLLSADAMRLLERFRTPATVTEAVLGYCAATGADPMTTVDEAFGVLVAATRAQLLVVEGSEAAAAVTDRLRVGQTVGPATIRARLRVLRDSEIWRAVLADGTPVVVKVVDEPVLGPDLVAREVAALRRLAVLAGGTVPRLHWHEVSATGGTLVLGEVVGDPVDLAVCVATPQARLQVVAAVLEAYVAIHDHGVLHGDVHPGNVLVRPDGGVTVLDFGLAAVAGAGLPPPPRPTGGEHLDPETAAALRDDLPFPPLDAAGEQYSVAALAYRLLTGAPHLDLACERHVALGRIVADAPRRFTAVGATPWPAGERALRRALSRRPRDRYESLAALRDAVARAVPAAVPAAPAAGRRRRAA
ncbi:MAG TPA: AarF/UbiB family protein, partial [Mycobacteriales bacterium]